jgi:threonine dehydrogenase-like Zn-dependent dehydrogenase
MPPRSDPAYAVTTLTTSGNTEQLTYHLGLAKQNGATETDLSDRIWKRELDPGKVFDLTLPLADVAEGYKAMDERRAIKVLLQP